MHYFLSQEKGALKNDDSQTGSTDTRKSWHHTGTDGPKAGGNRFYGIPLGVREGISKESFCKGYDEDRAQWGVNPHMEIPLLKNTDVGVASRHAVSTQSTSLIKITGYVESECAKDGNVHMGRFC